jgi:hypothetical protein
LPALYGLFDSGKHGQEAAAAKTGISVASARRLDTVVMLPSQLYPRHWRTRTDPLAVVWAAESVRLTGRQPAGLSVVVAVTGE